MCFDAKQLLHAAGFSGGIFNVGKGPWIPWIQKTVLPVAIVFSQDQLHDQNVGLSKTGAPLNLLVTHHYPYLNGHFEVSKKKRWSQRRGPWNILFEVTEIKTLKITQEKFQQPPGFAYDVKKIGSARVMWDIDKQNMEWWIHEIYVRMWMYYITIYRYMYIIGKSK